MKSWKRFLTFILLSYSIAAAQTPPSPQQNAPAAAAQPAAQDPATPKLSEVLDTGELLLLREPAVIADPFDFGQLTRFKLGVFSLDGMSWTSTRFEVQGVDATNPYQPGRPLVSPGPNGVSEVSLTQPYLEQAPTVGYNFRQPSSESKLHFAASGFLTGGSLFSDNLPSSPAQRGILQQSDKYNHFYQPNAELGWTYKRWLYLLFTGSGRWANQAVPEVAQGGPTVTSYHLFGNVRATLQATKKDRIDVLIVGARLNSSDYATPFDLEALDGRRMAPTISAQPNMREEDHLDFVQTGWSRDLWGGPLEVRYSYSAAHADTVATNLPADYTALVRADQATTYVDLTTGAVSGGPLMQTLGVFPQHHATAVWRSPELHLSSFTNSFSVSGRFGRSESLIRELYPPYVEAITVNGKASSAMVLNTPLSSDSRLQPWEIGVGDTLRIGSTLAINAGLLFTNSNGSIPAQSAAQSDGTNPRFYPNLGTVVAWHRFAPRAGFSWQVPKTTGVVLRAGYGRNYHPLSGRDLDFANPNSLSGQEYQWTDPNGDGRFELNEEGALLRRFGGAYSSIDPHLREPYIDQFQASVEIALRRGFSARARAFDSIDRDRLAGVNVGVPFSAYQPVQIAAPGGQALTVYQQNPSSFGNDQFQLTNPAGLRMDQKGVVFEGDYRRDNLFLRASLFEGKSWGATNPGSDVWENDGGVVGSLYSDPNTLLYASGHPAMDRGYAMKFSAVYQTSRRWGNLQIVNDGVFIGGYPYAPMLLVSNLDQGPLLVPTGPRGMNGDRADAVIDWNLRVARSVPLKRGRLRVMGDIYNVPNLASRLRVNDVIGVSYRTPLSIQPPRSLRVGLAYEF